ncbi:DUF4432 family protein [Labrenzia sp. 011]|uniref:DUF4432 family protein n=1 Tax=Labrenzia sp. 011 TaxID=2171494 RepID=UPI000D51EA99|nr:DUF4432 family protein [Labrenzia sp. 011]PVB62306.1 hypothetical protein DCO57_08395 [Labrenzia sp. 011]
MTAPDLARMRRRYASLDAYAAVRLVTLGDGAERGVRVLELRSGGGLEAEIVVDRTFDIGRLALHGATVSWHAPSGYRSAAHIDAHGEDGQGFLTGMSGLLATCGFDHIRQPERETAFDAPLHPTAQIAYPLHGGGAHQPARLTGYGLNEEGPRPYIWCEGEVTQSMLFRGTLRLRRRIEMPLGGTTITLADTVTNIGPTAVSSMMLYHFNLGYPLVDQASVLSIDPAEKVWSGDDHDATAPFGQPPATPVSEISVHRQAAQDGMAECRLRNPDTGLTFSLAYSIDTLPYLQVLRVRGDGYNLIGIEPCSTAGRTRKAAREAGEMPMLSPGDSRRFSIEIALNSEIPQSEVTI